MKEPALTETVKTDLPSPKPNRRKRLALRFAVLVTAVSVVGAAYWFTRPPELVWWTTPPLGPLGKNRASVLIPRHWKPGPIIASAISEEKLCAFTLRPVDDRPDMLKWLLPYH